MNTDNMSDRDLATCVDEFVQRAIRKARNIGYDKSISIDISAAQYRQDSDYKIIHKAVVGDYPTQYYSETNNLVKSVDNACANFLQDALNTPKTIRPMITFEPSEGATTTTDEVPF